MSALPLRAPARPGPAEPGRPRTETPPGRRRRLRIVRAPARPRATIPFTMLCVTILAAALLGALLLNTVMAQTSFAIKEGQIELARLSERRQELSMQVQTAASPLALSQRAREAGMVPATSPAFLRLADGVIIGESVPARAQ